MRSGLESFGGSSILDLISLEDSTTTCINRQLRGENSFAYLNCDTQVLGEIIERALSIISPRTWVSQLR